LAFPSSHYASIVAYVYVFLRQQDDEPEHSEDEDEEADSEDEEAVELAQRQKLLNEEIRDLEAAVAKKKAEIAKSGNVIIKVRLASRSSLLPFPDSVRLVGADRCFSATLLSISRNDSKMPSESSKPTLTRRYPPASPTSKPRRRGSEKTRRRRSESRAFEKLPPRQLKLKLWLLWRRRWLRTPLLRRASGLLLLELLQR
jgi:hypothetical protein